MQLRGPLTLTILLSLMACGDATNLDQAATALVGHYAQHPPQRNWVVEAVKPDNENDRLVVDVLVENETDINQIKALSRMEQFTVAKLACPAMTQDLRTAIGTSARVWVQLKTPKEILTRSICPE